MTNSTTDHKPAIDAWKYFEQMPVFRADLRNSMRSLASSNILFCFQKSEIARSAHIIRSIILDDGWDVDYVQILTMLRDDLIAFRLEFGKDID